MSNTSEYESGSESSQSSSEYHSGQESEPDRMQIILVNREEEFTFLNIRFPMPLPYPHPYIQLKELMTTVTAAPESYDRITDISGNPNWLSGIYYTTSTSAEYHEAFEHTTHIISIKFTTQPSSNLLDINHFSITTILPENSYKMPLQKNG